MCMRYMVNAEMLGKRVTGYIFYDADTKGFTGLTEKQIKDTLGKGEKLYGLTLDGEKKSSWTLRASKPKTTWSGVALTV